METFRDIQHLLSVCYQCGSCTATCAIGLVNRRKNIRRLVQEIVSAADESELADNEGLWLCTMCHQCEDRCPQGVPLATLLTKLRNMAASKGGIPPSVKNRLRAVAECGYTFGPVRSMLSRRKKLGLPDLPQPDPGEIRELIRLAGQSERLDNPKEASAGNPDDKR